MNCCVQFALNFNPFIGLYFSVNRLHHYRSAGTLFYNTHPNELINAFRGGQRLRPTLRSKGQMSTQSVPNIHQMSTIEPPIDYLLPNSHLNLAGNSNVIVSRESRTESLQRRRSMSHHETMSSDRRIVSTQPVYTTIGNYQAYPKLIQVINKYVIQ